jgi:hypothetical protein
MRTQHATVVRHAAWEERDGVLFSPLLSSLGVVAGFTTRRLGSMGGRSTPLEEASENRESIARRLGFDAVARTKQVHGDTVVYVPFVRPGPASPARAVPHSEAPWPEADGMWTDLPGVLIGIAAADCVPILLADDRGLIGAAHAGWEGTSWQIARRLVAALRDAGADPSRIVATIGPSIGPCCYTIGDEREGIVRERLGPLADRAIVRRDGKTVLDLWTANVEQLRAEGVATVEVSGTCTLSGGADLWSYRARHAGATGSQREDRSTGLGLGFIGIRRTRTQRPPGQAT